MKYYALSAFDNYHRFVKFDLDMLSKISQQMVLILKMSDLTQLEVDDFFNWRQRIPIEKC